MSGWWRPRGMTSSEHVPRGPTWPVVLIWAWASAVLEPGTPGRQWGHPRPTQQGGCPSQARGGRPVLRQSRGPRAGQWAGWSGRPSSGTGPMQPARAVGIVTPPQRSLLSGSPGRGGSNSNGETEPVLCGFTSSLVPAGQGGHRGHRGEPSPFPRAEAQAQVSLISMAYGPELHSDPRRSSCSGPAATRVSHAPFCSGFRAGWQVTCPRGLPLPRCPRPWEPSVVPVGGAALPPGGHSCTGQSPWNLLPSGAGTGIWPRNAELTHGMACPFSPSPYASPCCLGRGVRAPAPPSPS